MAQNKLSNFTQGEKTQFQDFIRRFREELDEEDNLTMESLDHISTKLEQVQVDPISSAVTQVFTNAKIKPLPLFLVSDKLQELAALGSKEGSEDILLTGDIAKDLIYLVRNHVSFWTETECRTLIDMILLHVVSNMSDSRTTVGIVPRVGMDATTLNQTPAYHRGAVDLIVKGPPTIINFLLGSPVLALSNPDIIKNISCHIFQAKKDGFSDAVIQAAMESVVYSQQHGLKTYRSCVTNGENWIFFVFNADPSNEGGTVSISDEFSIQEDMSGLPLVLGLLRDWIVNSEEKDLRFFNYYNLDS